MIYISLNKELDYMIFKDFWNFSVAGADFGGKIKRDHPDINIENQKEYIDNFYEYNKVLLENKSREINSFLVKKQKLYFDSLNKLFNVDYSNDEYKGYLSIFDCNPRWPETKTFQIFYDKSLLNKLEVVFHEIMHFVFFDYCDKKLNKETSKFDKNNGVFWELSEIFNTIILNLPEFQNILEKEELSFYPDLKEKTIVIQNIWSKNSGNLHNFIIESLDYLNSLAEKHHD